MSQIKRDRQRLHDLSTDAELFGLEDAESAELVELRQRLNESTAQEYSELASRLMLAETTIVALPDSMHERLSREATRHFSDVAALQRRTDVKTAVPSLNVREAAAWLLAATLGVVLALVLWKDNTTQQIATPDRPGNQPPEKIVQDDQQSEAAVESPLQLSKLATAIEQRNELLRAADIIQVQWLPSKDPSALVATGDVVWSNEKQQGFLTFDKLAVNDPSVEQYQLWIIDGQRDAAKPVDGGVFDITKSEGQTTIAIDAKLEVFDPRAFAITIEKPGGVVVSDRSRLPLLASLDLP